MRNAAAALAVFLLCNLTVLADDAREKAPALDAKKLLGDWNYVSGQRAGKAVAKDRLAGTVSITRDSFTLPGGPDSTFVMTYKIDATKNPAHIDLKIKSGPVPEGATIGIVRVKGDRMMLCYDPTGQKRPEKFKSTEDNGTFLFVLKRAKPKKKD